MKQTYETGLRGEETAENWLRENRGMACLARRHRNACGEIDLVMLDGETVVFVEVKTRRTAAPGTGMMAVGTAKQKRIARSAMAYLMATGRTDCPVRFDVVEVNAESLIHVPDAFQPGGMFYR